MALAPPAIRYIASSSPKSLLGNIYLTCHVKPSATRQRQGILLVSDHVIELCVSAEPRNGKANEAVREVISEALKCPKSDVEVVRGLKSREKTVSVQGIAKGEEEVWMARYRELLECAI